MFHVLPENNHIATDGSYKMKIAIYFFLTALFVNGCNESRWYREFELDEKTFDSEAMQMIRRDTGFNLPEGVRGLNFRYSPPIDPSFIIA